MEYQEAQLVPHSFEGVTTSWCRSGFRDHNRDLSAWFALFTSEMFSFAIVDILIKMRILRKLVPPVYQPRKKPLTCTNINCV